jgi:sigma-B regulation protein RsbU (phosphoserine phosphatase)
MACEECSAGEFISLFYGIIDAEKRTITYCNCGHEPPALFRERRIIDLNKGGLVLGVMAHAEYQSETIQLKDDDSLLFYTDGLIDASNFDGDTWGRERLLKTFNKCHIGSAGQVINNILAFRRRFVGLARQVDDTSLVVVRVSKTNSFPG